MRETFLPFTRPCVTEDDIAKVVEVLRSGWITNGPVNQAFEETLARYTGNARGVALASATAGMHLVLAALDIGPGDEVITPSLTWVSTVNMIVLRGATPVFAEVDRDTLMVTPESIRERITGRTKLIIPVHYAGMSADLDGIRGVAGSIPVVEDAAHALGTFYKGRHVGSGNSAVYSFHAIKNITAGEGGMFVSDDVALADRVRRLKFHGIGMDAFDRQNRGRSPQAEVIEPGFKYNLTDYGAALALNQLKRVDEINARRRELAREYLACLAEVPELRPAGQPAYDFVHAWHLMIVRVDSPRVSRDAFMEAMKRENIGTGLHFRCAHLQRYYREAMHCRPGMLPNTEYNSDHMVSLPLFPDMNIEDVHEVIHAAKRVLSAK